MHTLYFAICIHTDHGLHEIDVPVNDHQAVDTAQAIATNLVRILRKQTPQLDVTGPFAVTDDGTDLSTQTEQDIEDFGGLPDGTVSVPPLDSLGYLDEDVQPHGKLDPTPVAWGSTDPHTSVQFSSTDEPTNPDPSTLSYGAL